MSVFHDLREEIISFVKKAYNVDDVSHIVVEAPKDNFNGDLASNAAMVLASKVQDKPREIAAQIKDALSDLSYVAHIEIAGPGFLNFTIKPSLWQDNLFEIIKKGEKYGCNNIGKSRKVNVEYVSANPTGPMHIGHARGAVYGDALANLLDACGYDVTKEYYINDAGNQIDTLLRSAFLRYKEEAIDENIDIPEGLYPGDYLIPVGKKLFEKYGADLLSKDESEMMKQIRDEVLEAMMDLIKNDLLEIGVKHDVFFSEAGLHSEKKIEKAIELLEKKDLIFEGTLPPPKGMAQEDWVAKEQTLFRSTYFGDDQDRPVKKSDGSWTYFAADMAYGADKVARGFESVIVVLGADHSGYVKRMEAIIKSLSEGKVECDIKLCQLVNYLEDGDLVKMSKRAGTFTTVRDVIQEVGKDIVRFIMLTRKNDIPLDFDIEKVKDQSKDNPVFYVNYAHVRALSILRNAKQSCGDAYEAYTKQECDLSLLTTEEEMDLMKLLASWPKILEGAAVNYEPHRIAFYLMNLASSFHSLWNLGKENNDYRFVIEEDTKLTSSRLMLVEAVRLVVNSGLKLIGTTPMNKM